MTTQTVTTAPGQGVAPACAVTDEDRAAIAALPQRVVAAWAAHDADAFAEVFTPDGTMIIPGVFQKGREAIRAFLAQAFEGPFKGTRVTGTPVDLRFANAESGILITQGGILAPGESEPSTERAVNASWIVIKRDGRWLLASYQNSPRNAA
jgi:uncharacterized protein (TIGR02246 family)